MSIVITDTEMNAISSFSIYFLLLCFLGIGAVLYFLLFQLVLKFKWNVDYFYMRDKSCYRKNWTKFEIESYRYNLYAFFYNIYWYSYLDTKGHDISDKYVSYSFKTIKDSYSAVYFVFIAYIIILMIGFAAFLVFKGTIFAWALYAMTIIVFVVYFVVNGIVIANFNKMQDMMNNQNNALFRYNAVYKILNAIILISNLQNLPVEYAYYKLNENKLTFEEILQSNIAACENLANTSKIIQVKNNVYENLDFIKYMVLDKVSPFYWKYFDNPYIRLPREQTKQYDTSENIYLNEIYLKRNSYIDYDNVSIQFSNIQELIKDNTNDIYTRIYQKINNDYPDVKDYKKVYGFYAELYKLFSTNNSLEAFNKVLYDQVNEVFSNIESLLKNQQYNGIYNDINLLIHDKIHEKEYTSFDIPNNDYIEYFLDNKDILFDSESEFNEIISVIENQSSYIYAYFAFFIFIFMLISHYLYKTINGPKYIYIMSIVVVIYLSYAYIQTAMTGI